MSFLREASERASKAEAIRPEADLILKDRPALVEYLTVDRWPGGKARVTSTLMLCFAEDRFRACLNDRDGQRSVWVSGATLDACLDALEAGLQADVLEWRAMKPFRKGR